jgi:hypothetical protein
LVQLKSRERPTNLLHAAVGTSAEIKAREETKKKFQSLTLTKAHLDPLVLSQAELSTWGYMVELPDGPGGNCPSEEGRSRACERCGEKFEVRRASEGQQCTFHHGKLRSVRIEGMLVWGLVQPGLLTIWLQVPETGNTHAVTNLRALMGVLLVNMCSMVRSLATCWFIISLSS